MGETHTDELVRLLIKEIAKMSEMKTMKDLRERTKEFSAQLPLMEGRDKGDSRDLIGNIVTITDYGFLPNDKGEDYAVFTVAERATKFYFGGMVLTDHLKKLHSEGYYDVIVKEGLPMLLTEKRSKNKMTYTNVVFFPE